FHGFFFQMAYPCLPVARRGARPVVASFRGIDAHWLKERLGQVELEILAAAAWITSVSSDALIAADAFVDVSGRSSFIPNSVDTALYPAWRLTPDNRGVVGTVCTLREKKGIPLLVQAFGRLPAGVQRRLLLVGDYAGPEAAGVRAKTELVIARYGVTDKVEVTGLVPHRDVPGRLLDMNVFVVASKHEGLPNAVLEAAAAGVPIVATAVDGTKDVFRDETSALLVPPGDPIALGAAIERVLSEPGLAARLSSGGRALAASLRPEAERRAWLGLYQRLLDEAQERRRGHEASRQGGERSAAEVSA
ncbi:MAG TPA: glycosyltransferase family 4 protein, partial [Labilithrix sp.]|nr:glycosyltransferase family 4 protein [Labilithrix sp.]